MKNEIKDKILEYFNNDEYSPYLECLDNDDKEKYTGVTIDYIKEFVLDDKYDISIIAKCLKELHLDDKIHSLYCGHIESIVFENKDFGHWNFQEEEGNYSTHIRVLHKYLNKIINE